MARLLGKCNPISAQTGLEHRAEPKATRVGHDPAHTDVGIEEVQTAAPRKSDAEHREAKTDAAFQPCVDVTVAQRLGFCDVAAPKGRAAPAQIDARIQDHFQPIRQRSAHRSGCVQAVVLHAKSAELCAIVVVAVKTALGTEAETGTAPRLDLVQGKAAIAADVAIQAIELQGIYPASAPEFAARRDGKGVADAAAEAICAQHAKTVGRQVHFCGLAHASLRKGLAGHKER